MTDTFRRYETNENDRWDLIASKFRTNPYDYVDIIKANPQYQGQWLLPGGVIIRVPVKDTTNVRLIPPWERLSNASP